MAEAKLVVSVEENGVVSTTADLNNFSKASKKADTSTKNLAKTGKTSQAALSGVGKRAGQAGIQVQQFVGQVQGGTSAFVALSQQAADLGFVLGFPLLGAVTGIAAAFAGSLLPNLFESKDASEELEDALANLSDIIDITDDNVIKLSKSVITLAQVNEKAAQLEVARGLLESAKAAESAADVIQDTVSEVVGGLTIGEQRLAQLVRAYEATGRDLVEAFPESRDFFTRVNFPALTDALVELQSDFNLTEEEAASFFSALGQQITDRSAESAERLGSVVSELGLKYTTTNRDILELSSNLSRSTATILEQARATQALQEILDELNRTQGDINDLFDDDLIADERKSQDLLEKEQQKRAAAREKREEQLFKRRLDLARSFRKQNELEQIDYLNRLTQAETNAQNFLIEVSRLGESPVEQIGRIESEKLATLEQFRAEDLVNQQQYEDAKTAITEEAIRQRSDLQQANTMMIVSSTADLFESLAQLEASFGDRRSSRFKTLFALSKGFAIANSLLNLNAAVVQAAADPTALTPAQKFANIAAVTAALGGVVSSIASARLPARAQGGQFAANQPFLVGENGAEIVQFNSGGRIASNSDSRDLLSGSGGMGNVTIINQTSGRVDSTDRQVNQDGDLIITIKEVLKEEVVQANSGFNKAFNQTRKSQRIL